MQEKSPPTTWIVLSFTVCCLLIVVSTSIGFYALQMQARMTDECLETEQVRQGFNDTFRHFDAMKYAVLRQRQMIAPDAAKELERHFAGFREAVAETLMTIVSHENRNHLDEIHVRAEKFFVYGMESSNLAELQERNARDRVMRRNDLLQSIHEMQNATTQNMKKEAVLQDEKNFFPERLVVRQNELQELRLSLESHHRQLDELRFVQDPTVRVEQLKRIEERLNNSETFLEHLRQQVTTGATRELVEKMFDAYRHYRQCCDSYVRPLLEQDALQSHMDAVSNEVEQLSVEVRERLAKRSMELAEVNDAASHFMITQLILAGIFSVGVCTVLGFFTVRKVIGVSPAASYDPYAEPRETDDRDMSVIANKLQEVVDLLKR